MTVTSAPAVDLNASTLPAIADGDFLRFVRWKAGADRAFSRLAATGDVRGFSQHWRSQAKERGKLSGEWLFVWSVIDTLPEDLAAVQGLPLPQKGTKARKPSIHPLPDLAKRSARFLERLASPSAELTAHDLLAAAELVVRLGQAGPLNVFWRTWRTTFEAAQKSLPLLLDASVSRRDELVRNRGELPYVLGLLFAPTAAASEWRSVGAKFLRSELVKQTDSDGTPHAELLPILPLWLASLARSTAWSHWAEEQLWTGDADGMMEALWERALPLCQQTGRLVFSNGHAVDPFPILRGGAVALDLPPGPMTSLLKGIEQHRSGKVATRKSADGAGLMPSNQSDWARFALLRSDWSSQADTVAIAHHRPIPFLEASLQGRSILRGDWGLTVVVGESSLELADEWSCVCWQSEADADYLELQMCGPKRMRVERLALLSRTEGFLLMADSIRETAGAPVHYRGEWALAEGVTYQPEKSSRSGWLVAQKQRVRVVPLGIPQDRVISTPHQLTVAETVLRVEQHAAGRGLFAPVLFDWHPARQRLAAEWRQLTVTENGSVVANDVAVGYRVRIGELHLLIYRSLKPCVFPRAVLGHHTTCETLIGLFDAEGNVEPILSVETED